MYPITPWSQLFTGVIILFGIAIVGLPVAIIAAGLTEEREDENE